MLERFDLYLPHARRNVTIQVSIPSNYKTAGIVYDSLYCLDGQNVFRNSDASFGCAMHLNKYLSFMGRRFSKRICGIAIWNAMSDLGRTNEYAPWVFTGDGGAYKGKQNPKVCRRFTQDFIEVIIPCIQKRYPVSKEAGHTAIFGSSLGALYASYLSNAYPHVFGAAGLFSNCQFLCENAYYSFLRKSLNVHCRTYLYVGLQEYSDGRDTPDQYFFHAKKLHKFLNKHHVPNRLDIDIYGTHSESSWEKHLLSFLMYLYFDDITAAV